MVLRRTLRAELLEGGSKEAIRLGAGFLSTLAALVIGLMIASAKNTYDNQNSNIRQLGTNAVLVDQMLTNTDRTQRRRAPCCAKSSPPQPPASGGKTSRAKPTKRPSSSARPPSGSTARSKRSSRPTRNRPR
ncbi:hypothetical protein CQ14_27945 [Bradyrhizobium lablabi]|uniref:Uncharacterized protein n=1 Tax=Bradyrhizobium lablabi TaxID=722472 RepID=A0A0R3MHS8_9BRAD|nr:hypothetical protein CQ14_27945 [Bradyrhizobium lablabi]